MILLAALLLSSQAEGTAPPPPAAVVPAVDKKICRSMVMTGSIMAKRSCRTNAEWAKLQESTDNAWEMARRKRGFVSRDPERMD